MNHNEYYPQLVRMFYTNIKTIRTGPIFSLECQVKYTKFILTESVLDYVLGLPPIISLSYLAKNVKLDA